MQKQQIYEAHFWRGPAEWEMPIYPYCSEFSFRTQPHRINMSRFPFMLICGISEGALQFHFSSERYLLESGDVLLIPPRTAFAFESYSTRTWYAKQVLELKGNLLESLLEMLHLNGICLFRQELREEFSETFRKIHALNKDCRQWDIPESAATLYRFLHICSNRKCSEHGSRKDPVLANACNWIDEHLNLPVNLNLLEEKLNISRSTLCRLFKAGKGISPRDYWISRRNERAEFLLLHSELSIKEIAYLLGYSSQFHFSNEFRCYHNISPLHYRKRGFV